MSRFFSFSQRGRKNLVEHNRCRLQLETLEDRLTPSGNVISGYVYYDANNNGAFDPAETPIANSPIELVNSTNQIVGTTTTDANGFYQFTTDQTQHGQPETLTKTVTFPATETNFSLQKGLDQFDPSLGTLQSISIQHAGSITSEIKVENLSTTSSQNISGTVSGHLVLTGPGGVNDDLAISGYAGSFQAAAYDGTTDFGGTSGTSFGQKTADGSDSITLTGDQMTPYIGTGQVQLTESGNATSNASGGGNVEVNVASTGEANVTVTYNYIAFAPLGPGDYTIEQTAIPTGYTPGKVVGGNGTVYPTNPTAPETIPVVLNTNGTSTNNNFGELKPTGISGFVYYDANNNGVFDPGESGIQGVTMTLTNPGGSKTTATTDANGFYDFDKLVPGTYTVGETQPTAYLNGIDTAGTNNGTVNNIPNHETIASITLSSGDSAQNYNFGELQPASLAGNVYVDAQNDGRLDPGDPPIAKVTVTLTGLSDQGPVSETTKTASDGTYSFTNLRPGTYAITETQPKGYNEGATTVGTQSGTGATDVISAIQLNAGVAGTNNNFGELKPNSPTPPTPLPKDVGQLGGTLPAISKSQLLSDGTGSYLSPALRGEMTFVMGATEVTQGYTPNLTQIGQGVNELNNGMSRSTFIAQLWSTNAHRAIQVDTMYQSILNRVPTSSELTAGIATLQSSGAIALASSIYTSTAYQQLHPTSDGLATALSQDILNVTPGSADLQSLVQSMGAQPLSTVVNSMLNSTASLANFIDNTYRRTLDRPATASQIQTWTTQIQSSSITLDQLGQRLLASQEFYQLAYNAIH